MQNSKKPMQTRLDSASFAPIYAGPETCCVHYYRYNCHVGDIIVLFDKEIVLGCRLAFEFSASMLSFIVRN